MLSRVAVVNWKKMQLWFRIESLNSPKRLRRFIPLNGIYTTFLSHSDHFSKTLISSIHFYILHCVYGRFKGVYALLLNGHAWTRVSLIWFAPNGMCICSLNNRTRLHIRFVTKKCVRHEPTPRTKHRHLLFRAVTIKYNTTMKLAVFKSFWICIWFHMSARHFIGTCVTCNTTIQQEFIEWFRIALCKSPETIIFPIK